MEAIDHALHVARKSSQIHAGPIRTAVPGRTDRHNVHVKSGSYVVPADVISGWGEGNTLAGFEVAKQLPSMWKALNRTQGAPYEKAGLPYDGAEPRAKGGAVLDGVPVVVAGGEHVYEPEEAAIFGDGDLNRGHAVLDELVKLARAQHIKTLKNLPGPRRD